jgi:hypothetical protein
MSSPTAVNDGGGRLQPRLLTSEVSTAAAFPQVFPLSDDAAYRRIALLSGRTDHHTAYTWDVAETVWTVDAHNRGSLGRVAASIVSDTNFAVPAESTMR